MAPPRFERCHVLQSGRWTAVPHVRCICDSFSPERIWNIGRSHHSAGLLEKFSVHTFCDTILFRRVGGRLLMIDSSALQVLLELAREVFTTTIRYKRLYFAPCALLQFLDEVTELPEHLTLVTNEAHLDTFRTIIRERDKVALSAQ